MLQYIHERATVLSTERNIFVVDGWAVSATVGNASGPGLISGRPLFNV
jgi:hypothetical protein